MAAGAVHGPPYPAVQWLSRWTVDNLHWVKGNLLLTGQRFERLTIAEALDVAYTLQIRDYSTVLGHDKNGQAITLADYRGQVDAGIRNVAEGRPEMGVFNEATWGTTPQALASQQSLLSMVGDSTLQLGKVEGEVEGQASTTDGGQ